MKKIILVILFLVFTLAGCSTSKTQAPSSQETDSQVTDSQKQLLQPKQVVENHFKYYTEKNKDGILSTLTERKRAPSSNNDFGFENLKYKKINNISEDFNSSRKENYFKYDDGAKNGIKKEDVKFYKVEYTVKYKTNTGPQPSGKYTWWYTLIRKDKNSPWLIDEWGEG